MFNSLLTSLSLTEPLQYPLGGWAYVLLAILTAVEGPIATLAGAVAASTGLLNPVLVFVSASLGNLTADTLWYSLGYVGKTEWLAKVTRWFGIKDDYMTNLQKDVHNHIYKLLFVAKLTLGFVIPTLIAAGLTRIPLKRWFGVLFAAECIWTGSLVIIGYYFGALTQQIETNLRWVSLAGAMIFVAIIIVFISQLRRRTEKEF